MKIITVHDGANGGYVVNKATDNMGVPSSPGNRHYQMVQDWINAGNTPTPYVAPVPTWEDQIAESDRTLMPRWMEDHITSDHGGVAGNANLQAKYDQKVALRNSKPS